MIPGQHVDAVQPGHEEVDAKEDVRVGRSIRIVDALAAGGGCTFGCRLIAFFRCNGLAVMAAGLTVMSTVGGACGLRMTRLVGRRRRDGMSRCEVLARQQTVMELVRVLNRT